MTGQFFAPEILAADGQIFLDAVRDEIIRQIDMTPEAAVEAGYWEDYQDIAQTGAATRSPSMRRG
mgnify:CR=1 FL=1